MSFWCCVQKEVVISDEDILFDDMEDKEEDLVERAPVVVVMGHVDHWKNLTARCHPQNQCGRQRSGGITQHIGAYKVNIHGRDITFLDTPGTKPLQLCAPGVPSHRYRDPVVAATTRHAADH